MNEFKYTADKIIINSRFKCVKKLLTLTKATKTSIYSTIFKTNFFFWTSSSIKLTKKGEAKKVLCFDQSMGKYQQI